MKRVIAAIDESAAAPPVLVMARSVSSALGAELDVLHVAEGGPDGAGASAESVGVPMRTVSGDPFEELALAIAEEDVVALVLGARGSGTGPRPAGHLVLALAGRTDKPVVVVPPGAQPPTRLHTVLVAMEGTPGKARTLRRTIELSADAGLEIVVVHVDEEVPSFTDQIQHETEAYAQEFFAQHILYAPQVSLELRIGDPAPEVLSAIDSFHPDLVAVGWPHAAAPHRAAVAREILARSPVPVLLVAVT
jgi:nucleotide-binding universal stress UspA family protein